MVKVVKPCYAIKCCILSLHLHLFCTCALCSCCVSQISNDMNIIIVGSLCSHKSYHVLYICYVITNCKLLLQYLHWTYFLMVTAL